ncbi:unnamed protein product [Caenorhabditis auriculariae]|uniref:CHK kinase-like domain-containing protein n=1 Tax=Caenorhabditis auriculariae TaxID=2777116 RepID=A0A8S1HQZ1_9PELO|nr:unnamed protein product [Caenorhabditis auriculariae]
MYAEVGRRATENGAKLENIGAGKGNLSNVLLLRESQLNGLANSHGALVVKTTMAEPVKILANQVRTETLAKMHNTELSVYEVLGNHSNSQIPHPKIYAMQRMIPPSQGFIVMQYIDQCEHVSVYSNLTPDQLIEPLKAAARLHALTYEMTSSERDVIPKDLITSWFSELFCEENMLVFLNGLERLASAGLLTQSAIEAIPVLKKVLTNENLHKLEALSYQLGMRDVLCHGDLWPPNLMFQQDEKAKLTFRCFIDFQTANMGCAAQDICRLLATSLSGKDRRDSCENLLAIYYDELAKASHPHQPPFTVKQLLVAYQTYLPFASAVFCLPISLGFLGRTQKMEDNELRAQMAEVMSEKFSALLEDAATFWNKFE